MTHVDFFLEAEGTAGGLWPTLLMIGGLLLVLYFFMIRPQRKQEKKDAEMRDSLAVGDEVTTIGGIIGKIVSIKGETFVLETTKDKTKIRFLKNAVRTVDVRMADLAAQSIAQKETKPEESTERKAAKKAKKTDSAEPIAAENPDESN